MNELPDHVLKEAQQFFEDYKELEGKETSVNGIVGPEEAIRTVEDSITRYNEQKR